MNYSFRNKYFLLFLSSLLFWFIFSDKTYAATQNLRIVQDSIPTTITDAPFGGTIRYRLTVTNLVNLPAANISITDNLPVGITGVTWTCAGTGGGTCPASGSGNVNITTASVTGTASTIVVTITGTAPFSGTFPTPVTNSATTTVGAGDTDSNLANNTTTPALTTNVNYEDFGDAPDSYGTLFASNGARHTYNPQLRMGVLLDSEVDGVPGVNANGDNIPSQTNVADEDGLSLIPSLVSAQTTAYSMSVNVKNFTASTANLIGWIDFNRDGVFTAAEASTPATAVTGINGNVTLTWPANVSGLGGSPPVAGASYIRLRITTASITSADFLGLKSDGEVEDYSISIVAAAAGTGTITSSVYIDNNYNGAFDTNIDKGLANVPVTLQNPAGTVCTTVLTDSSGTYRFTNLAPGSYTVVVNGKNSASCGTPSGIPATGLFASPPTGYGGTTTSRLSGVNVSSGVDSLITSFGVALLSGLSSFENTCPVDGFLAENPTFAITAQTTLNSISIITNAKSTLGPKATIEYNAMGFNNKDAYLYGIRLNSSDLVRIDKAGYALTLGEVIGLPLPVVNVSPYFAGDYNPFNDFLYVNGLGTANIYALNTNTITLDSSKTITLSPTLSFVDFAFNPTPNPSDSKNYIYGTLSSDVSNIYKINPSPGVTTAITITPTGLIGNESSAPRGLFAGFFDPDNNFYVENNFTTLQRIKLNTNQDAASAITIQSGATDLKRTDGARCPFSKVITDAFDFYAPNTTSVFPGATVIYPHKLTATLAGSVSLNINSSEGYIVTVFKDVNNNGLLDAGDTAITDLANISIPAPPAPTPSNTKPISEVNILIRFQAPASVASTIVESTTLSSTFTPSGSAFDPVVKTLVDITKIGELKGGTLRLDKTVTNKSFKPDGFTLFDPTGKTANPGHILEYTLTYTNISGSTLKNIKINDIVPPNTTFISAGFNAPATGTFTGPTGAARTLVWDLGAFVLPQNGTGSVTFRVSID
ncbi:MAG: SdrD B-like domain-containing protein [Cyanobacteriota bacterium]|mgnify:CR=1 FL=1